MALLYHLAMYAEYINKQRIQKWIKKYRQHDHCAKENKYLGIRKKEKKMGNSKFRTKQVSKEMRNASDWIKQAEGLP